MDKNKIIEAATKFVQAGKYDKAIKEYEKIVAVDPKDARIQQKLGELYQKKGDNAQAADYFLKVGESYAADGFALRAVAVYKQVLKLDEKRIDVNLKLAELYQQLGLMSDAMTQLQLVSAHYEKSGNASASLDLLKRMVELDPDNVASRIKLAELYARDSMNAEAVAEFNKAATFLKRNNRVDDYLKVAERLVFLDPGNIQLSRELAQLYLAKADTKRALAKLQICFKADPRDVETLNLLAQAFQDLGQTSKTVSVLKELAKIYDEQDKVDDERQVWERVAQIAPDDPDAQRKLSAGGPAPEPEPEPEPAPPPQPVRPVGGRATGSFKKLEEPAGLSPDQLAKLLTETDVYVKYGLTDKALEHLKKVFAADPENLEAHDKSYQIAVNSGEKAAVTEEKLIKVIRLAASKGDLVRARARLQTLLEQNPGHDAVPEFLQTIGTAPAEEHHEVLDDDSLIIEDEAEVVADEPAMAAVHEGDEMIVAEGEGEVLAAHDEPLALADEPQAEVVDEPLVAHDEPLLAHDEPLAVQDEALAATGHDEPLAVHDDEPLVAHDEPLVAQPEVHDEALLAATEDSATVHGEVSLDDMVSADEVLAGDPAEVVADAMEPGVGFELADGGDEPFAQARAEAVSPEGDEPPTGQQDLPPVRDESDFGDLNDYPPENGFAGEGEGATRVVNLADLAKLRDEVPTKTANRIAPPPSADDLPTRASMQVAPPPSAHANPEEAVTMARVPVARPPSRPAQQAVKPSPASMPAAKVATSASLPAASGSGPLGAKAPGRESTGVGPAPGRPPSKPPASKPTGGTLPTMAAMPVAGLVKASRPDSEESATVVGLSAFSDDDEDERTTLGRPAFRDEAEEAPSSTVRGFPAFKEPEPEPVVEEAAPAAEEEADPAGEELEEARFFIEQGVLDEAREILETIALAYPGNAKAAELMAELERKEAEAAGGGSEAAAEPAPSEPSGDQSFDLAAELAEELGDSGGDSGAEAPLSNDADSFQISAEDVFAEFKKGVSKVVKPEDVDTHYDLGIAYKEMGLLGDAIGEFEVAMKGASGKPREVDCHVMVASCKQLQGDQQGAIMSFRLGLALPQTSPEQTKALQFDVGAAYEAMGQMGRALAYYQKVAKVDPRFRDAQSQADRLVGDGAEPEDDEPLPAPKKANGTNGVHVNGAKPSGGSSSGAAGSPTEPSPPNKPASRKIGYV